MALLTKDARAAVPAAAGTAPGPGGYDPDQPDRCARARGRSWTSTPATTYHGRPGRWTASVLVPADQIRGRGGFVLGSRSADRSEAEAPERALATAPARGARGGQASTRGAWHAAPMPLVSPGAPCMSPSRSKSPGADRTGRWVGVPDNGRAARDTPAQRYC